MKYVIAILLLVSISCTNKKDTIMETLKDWENRELFFPSAPVFTVQGDTVNYQIQKVARYKILSYIDSTECLGCKMRLFEWKQFITLVDSLSSDTVQFLFFLSSKNKMDINRMLITDRFVYPVCVDEHDSINKLNNFHSDYQFQTFLLDEYNKVVLVGNPIYNNKVKELYLKIITGEERIVSSTKPVTSLRLNKQSQNMGDFDWEQEQFTEFILTNSGSIPLIIENSSTSCGCTIVEYSKEPVQKGKNLTLKVKYKADHPEHFNKTITVYCNTKDSPLQLKISGNAK